ncbi:MAG: hypothetical protein V8R83_06075 [Candidatus Gastranaerophilaceae bacterium]
MLQNRQLEESAPAGTATIDVDLANGAAVDKVADKNAPAAVKEDPEKARLEKMEKEGKELNAVEKALLKKKKDEAKENQGYIKCKTGYYSCIGGRTSRSFPSL